VLSRLFLLFTLFPLLELYLLVQIGERVGFLPTLLGVIGVGLVGAAVARREGFRVLREWQDALAHGTMPSEGALGGALLLVGGVLLVTPGVISDVLGLVLLFPMTRRIAANIVRRRLERSIESGSVKIYGIPGMGGPFGPASPGAPRPAWKPPRDPRREVIDVEGEVLEVDGRKPSR
jgi:UPF0716 protein FxsA